MAAPCKRLVLIAPVTSRIVYSKPTAFSTATSNLHAVFLFVSVCLFLFVCVLFCFCLLVCLFVIISNSQCENINFSENMRTKFKLLYFDS